MATEDQCSACGERNPAGSAFCVFCGTYLGWEVAGQGPAAADTERTCRTGCPAGTGALPHWGHVELAATARPAARLHTPRSPRRSHGYAVSPVRNGQPGHATVLRPMRLPPGRRDGPRHPDPSTGSGASGMVATRRRGPRAGSTAAAFRGSTGSIG